MLTFQPSDDCTVPLFSSIERDQKSVLLDSSMEIFLRLFWSAAIFPIVIASLPFGWLGRYYEALSGISKRGKMHPASHRYTVPQRWFAHFYVVAVAWTSILLVSSWTYAYKISFLDSTSLNHSYTAWKNVLVLVLMETQVLMRLFESLYVFDYNPEAQMHFIGYLTGLFYYAAAPLSLCCNIAMDVYNFCIHESITSGVELHLNDIDLWKLFFPLLNLGWIQWIGAAIFFWGWIHQRCCHRILGSLRATKDQGDKYVIPRGDWFEMVSSPHYLAEIVIYGGLVVASGGTEVTIWFLFGFVVSNLGFAAAETHRWYLRKFEDYPRNRYAIVPLLC